MAGKSNIAVAILDKVAFQKSNCWFGKFEFVKHHPDCWVKLLFLSPAYFRTPKLS